ncbi:MAG: hypothetical protein EOM37_03960 [Proteobacteria bacterium]|nr:hypothetical protein [Alphaproteobacteria bacterium]NCC03190.1 hypothetical protein [Pseudomonadota bacterium]
MIDLDAYKAKIVEGSRPFHVDYWCPNVEDHIAQTRHEFVGKPELCAYHAGLIIRIRRRLDLQNSLDQFFFIWREAGDFLLEHLDSRWLISALDTFADYGIKEEQTCAIAIIAMMNMAMLGETDHMLCGSPMHLPEKIRENMELYPDIWDKRRVFHLDGDDTFANTLRRLRRIFAGQTMLMKICEHMVVKMFEGESVLSRLAARHARGLW